MQLLVVTKAVATGAEFLTDYGEDYWRATLGFVPAPVAAPPPVVRRPPSPAVCESSDDEECVTRQFMRLVGIS